MHGHARCDTFLWLWATCDGWGVSSTGPCFFTPSNAVQALQTSNCHIIVWWHWCTIIQQDLYGMCRCICHGLYSSSVSPVCQLQAHVTWMYGNLVLPVCYEPPVDSPALPAAFLQTHPQSVVHCNPTFSWMYCNPKAVHRLHGQTSWSEYWQSTSVSDEIGLTDIYADAATCQQSCRHGYLTIQHNWKMYPNMLVQLW